MGKNLQRFPKINMGALMKKLMKPLSSKTQIKDLLSRL